MSPREFEHAARKFGARVQIESHPPDQCPLSGHRAGLWQDNRAVGPRTWEEFLAGVSADTLKGSTLAIS
jgi:hypothetical protein